MSRIRRRKLRSSLSKASFHRILPNMATIAALCAGMSAMRFAFMEKWDLCVSLVILAAILDGMDGRLARMLGSVSRFGAQLDSLSDFMSFGVAPAFILYSFSLKNLGGVGWAVTITFTVCMSLRLARFNVQAETPSPLAPLRAAFFTGVPAPAAAILGLSPLILWLDQKILFAKNPWFAATVALITAVLMISRFPTYAFKNLKVSQNILAPTLVAVALLVAGLISAPWRTLLVMNGIYLCLIPISTLRYRALSRSLLVASSHDPLS